MRTFVAILLSLIVASESKGEEFSGNYHSESISLDIYPRKSDIFRGQITYNGNSHSFYAIQEELDLVGLFQDGEAMYPFQFNRKGGRDLLSVAGNYYVLSKVSFDPKYFTDRVFQSDENKFSISLQIDLDGTVAADFERDGLTFQFQGSRHEHLIEGLIIGESGHPDVLYISLDGQSLRIAEGKFAGIYVESKTAWPKDLDRSRFFSLEELFRETPYEKYNSYSRKLILKQAQAGLKKTGHYQGAVDGVPGRSTQSAIIAWQSDQSKSITGRLDKELLLGLNLLSFSELKPPEGYVERGADRDVFKTPEGIPLKIIARINTRLQSAPSSSADSTPVRTFDIFYVFEPEGEVESGGKTVNGYYEVTDGIDSDDSLGWVNANDVVEWPHRQAVGVIKASRRDNVPAKFFANQQDLQGFYGGEKVSPMSQEPEGAVGFNIIPILDKFEMEADGDKVNGYRVAYLHQGSGNTEKVEIEKLTFDVVFVIDTTISMAPWIEATRELVRRTSQKLYQQRGRDAVRFGLVGYRDTLRNPPKDWYTSKVFVSLDRGANFDQFLEETKSVKEATVSSGANREEDVLAGLHAAIDPGGRALGWKRSSMKHIVLIGDAAPELKNLADQTIDSILTLAQPPGSITSQYVFHTIALTDPGASSSFRKKTIEGFGRIGKGLGKGLGYSGESFTLSMDQPAEALVDALVDGICKNATTVSTVKETGKIPTDLSQLQGVLGQQYTFEMLLASQGSANIPSFGSGFACELDEYGASQLEPWVLVNFRRLSQTTVMIDAILNALEGAGEPGNRDVQKFLENLTNLTVALSLDLDITSETTPASIQQYILGIPAKTDAFNMTFQEIANMTQSDYEKWVRNVKESREKMEGVLESPANWYSINKSAQTAVDSKKVKFIRVRDLP